MQAVFDFEKNKRAINEALSEDADNIIIFLPIPRIMLIKESFSTIILKSSISNSRPFLQMEKFMELRGTKK